MSVNVLQRLDRRGFLAAAAAMVASSAGSALGQTLIQDTPSSDGGYSRAEAGASAYTRAGMQPLAQQQPASQAAAPVRLTLEQQSDWRKYLLAGERTIIMRRDGSAQRVRYCLADGSLDRDGYGLACTMLRDVQAGKLYPMDPRLLDILCGLQRWAEYNGRSSVIQLLSGFRTAKTNSDTEGAALNSMHLYGRAADVVFEGLSSGLMGAMIRAFNTQGGNGIYLNRGFVHVDTGAARSWVSTEVKRRR